MRLVFDVDLSRHVAREELLLQQKHIVECLSVLVETQQELLGGFYHLQRLFHVELIGLEEIPHSETLAKEGPLDRAKKLPQMPELTAFTDVGQAPRPLPESKDLSHPTALLQEQLASQEESRAIWSQKFTRIYGNPHRLVMLPQHLQQLDEATFEKPIEDRDIRSTTVWYVRKRLNLLEDGDRRIEIDKKDRAIVNKKMDKDGKGWHVQKSFRFENIVKILPHKVNEMHLEIQFEGNRPYHFDFAKRRDREVFLRVLRAQGVSGSVFEEKQETGQLQPPVDGKNMPIVDSAMRRTVMTRKLTGRLPVEYDRMGHPKPQVIKGFLGNELHPGRRPSDPEAEVDDPIQAMVPSNARTPALSRQQVAYLQARPTVAEDFYGGTVHVGTEADENSILHHGGLDDVSSVARSAKGVLVRRAPSELKSAITRQESHMYASQESLPDASTIGPNHLPKKEVKESGFKAEDHVMAYRMINKIDEGRQLTKEEVELAITTKYAEQAVQLRVRAMLDKDEQRARRRAAVYNKLVVEKGLPVSTELLREVERELIGVEETWRFREMIAQKQQTGAKQHLGHPLAFPLPDEMQAHGSKGRSSADGESQPGSHVSGSRASHEGNSRSGQRGQESDASSVASLQALERVDPYKMTITEDDLNGDSGCRVTGERGPFLEVRCERSWGGRVFHLRSQREGEVATADARVAGEVLLSLPQGTASVRKFSETAQAAMFRVTQSDGRHLRVAVDKAGKWLRVTGEDERANGKFSVLPLCKAERQDGRSGWILTFTGFEPTQNRCKCR